MNPLLINDYFNELDRLKKYSGSNTEGIISEAFKDLLKALSKQESLIFLSQYEFVSPQKNRIRPDGTIVYDLRVPLGYWEAKDTNDNLDDEIAKKFAKGYPQDNIIFENSEIAVLFQNRKEVIRCKMNEPKELEKLLGLFFGYERQEIADFRKAVSQFAVDLPAVLDALRIKIDDAYSTNKAFEKDAQAFLKQAKDTINPSVTEADIREMLIQHILTEEIFAHVFNESDFHRENNIAKELYKLESKFFTGAVKKDTLKALEPYYAAIRSNAAQITSHAEKQTFLKLIYERFYKVYNPKAADRLGVVYTPNEIVKFMIDGADWLCHKHFGKSLIDRHVEILDPATGTGTFICELLDHFRGQPDKIQHKYKEELHANEVAILPYYVANLNIEATYAAITGQFAEYPNLCFVDTLDNVAGLGIRSGHQHDMFGAMSDENIERIQRQNNKKISVVIGNPPYNAWQENFNMRNPNRLYKRIDQRIADTYIRKGTAQNKNSVYDMYIRFFRWASDRLHDDGILALITNRNFIDKAAFDGFRRDLAEEFAEIYVKDLGGDVRANPKLSGTRHNVFGIQTGVTITFLVKRKKKEACRIFYSRRPEFDTAEEKLAFLSSNRASFISFTRVEPDSRHNWLNLTDNDWESLLPLVDKETKAARKASQEKSIFKLFSSGLKSQRDEWVYDFSRDNLARKMNYCIEIYNKSLQDNGVANRDAIKWDAELERYAKARIFKTFESKSIVQSAFRPYVATWLYFDKHFNGRTYQLNSIFYKDKYNKTIMFSGGASVKPFQCLIFNVIPSYDALEKAQLLPFYRYTVSGERIDNITDWGLKQFEKHYGKGGSRSISKDAVFHYVYAVLHDPVYREKYAINLKRDFPRIPLYPDFWQWADWGEHLMMLHIGYENVEPWPINRLEASDDKSPVSGSKPILKSLHDEGIIRIDHKTTLAGIPHEAFAYKLGNRSALDWILDQYKEKTPKDLTIREKFNVYRFADYKEKVINLIARVTRVSVETMAITSAMKAIKRD